MDQRHETFHTLNDVGGRIWHLLGLGVTLRAVADALETEYDVPRAQLDIDLQQTVGQLLALHLIAAGPVGRSTRSTPANDTPAGKPLTLSKPHVVVCGALLFWFKVLLRLRGPHGALSWSDRRVAGRLLSDGAPIDAVRQVEYSVAVAGALFPGRARCLEQSLVLYHVLRHAGVSARFRLGAQPVPFMAHAWVEYRGEPINDLPEHVKWFVPFEGAP